MDPTANLEEQLAIAARVNDCVADACASCEHDGARLAELVEALHEWITRGGFLPAQWQKARG